VNARGFSLIETLVAVSIMAVALSTLAHLFIMSARANADAQRTTFASVLATQKLEQLRSQSAALAPQAVDSLSVNVAGLCDFLDEYGRPLPVGTAPPSGTVYVRRWSIESVPSSPVETLLLQVIVMRPVGPGSVQPAVGDSLAFGGAQLVTMTTRRAG
jgi:prepilin-type N-terminal cleavage/methylation domain-containing protein